jgi:hypothetical protein
MEQNTGKQEGGEERSFEYDGGHTSPGNLGDC